MWEGLGVVKTGRVMLGETDPVSLILGLADKYILLIFIEMRFGIILTCHMDILYLYCTRQLSF